MAERINGFSPHLYRLVGGDGDLCEELHDICFERTCLAPDATEGVHGEAPYLWNRVTERHASQLIDAEIVCVMIEEV